MRGPDGCGFLGVVGGLGRSFGMVCAWLQPFSLPAVVFCRLRAQIMAGSVWSGLVHKIVL